MKKNKAKPAFTRRRFLPFLSGGLFLPFLGSASSPDMVHDNDEGEYQTLLTKDGTVVKVKKTTVTNSKVVDKQVSNRSLLHMLKRKDSEQ